MAGKRPQNRNQRPRNSGRTEMQTRSGSPKRRAYDQARDMRRNPSQKNRPRRPAGENTGYPDTVEFPTRRQNNPGQRNTAGEFRSNGTGQSNSIEFPSQAAARNRPRSGQRPQGVTARYPGNSGNRPRNQNGQPQRRPANGRLRPTQATIQDPARRERKKKRRMTRAAIRRRRLMRRLTAFALLLCVIGVGVYLTVTMLFKISSIQVQTADGTQVQELAGYSSDQILSALGVRLEENIFSVDPGGKAAELEKVFPKLESIRVIREYPGTVVVRAAEATPSYAMQTKGGWLTLSSGLKILDRTSAQPEGLPTLYGGEPQSKTPGDQLIFEAEPAADSSAGSESAASSAVVVQEHRLESLNTLMSALDSCGLLEDVTRIEFEDTEQMAFLYQDRISVLLGTLNELDYKLRLGQYVLLNQDGKGCAATDTGVLDLSHLSASSTRKFRFAQGEPTLPSGYVAPEKTTEPEAEASPEAAPTGEETTGETDAAGTPEPTGEAQNQTTNQE